MSKPSESNPPKSRLNRSPVLRYDNLHGQGGSEHQQSPESSRDNSGRADMDVNGPSPVSGSSPIRQIREPAEVQPTTESKPVSPRDEVEISSAGKMLGQLNESGELRSERLAQIKAAVEAGTYDTPEKLEAALEKLLGEIEG